MDASGGAAAVHAGAQVVGLSATELAARVRAGGCPPPTWSAHLDHIAAVDAAPDRSALPLAGVPVAVRDDAPSPARSAPTGPLDGGPEPCRPPGAPPPAGNRPDGLPVAVRSDGPAGAETRLLWIAGELERRRPRRRHAPVLDPTASTPAAV